MPSRKENLFREIWPQCFIIFMAIIELIAVLVLFITEVGNVGVNFWTTNVFAGGWCGLIMLMHVILLFAAGCCAPKRSSAFRAVIISLLAILACATLIGFDAYFIAKPTTCILTPSCVENSASNATFSYNFRQWFFTLMNNWGPFKTYTESQAKLFVQAIQVGIGALCFILCIIYIIIYYICTNKSETKVAASPRLQQQQQQQLQQQLQQQQLQQQQQQPQQAYYPAPQPSYYGPPPPQPQYYQAPVPMYPRPPYAPQPPPGQIPWNATRRY